MRERLTESIVLRPIEQSDVKMIYKWNNDEFLGLWQGCEFVSLSEYQKRYDSGGFNNGLLQLLIIEVDEPVGLFVMKFPRPGLAQLGISLLPNFRGKGIAYKALQFAIKYIFNNYQIERIEADTDIENSIAAEPLIKAGFKMEGILRKYRFHHAKFHDAAMYSLIRNDFELIRKRKEVKNGKSCAQADSCRCCKEC